MNKYLHTHVHRCIIQNSKDVEATQVSLTDEWINKMWHVHTMEYYSALKGKEILTHTTTWMNLEAIMLNEINQS